MVGPPAGQVSWASGANQAALRHSGAVSFPPVTEENAPGSQSTSARQPSTTRGTVLLTHPWLQRDIRTREDWHRKSELHCTSGKSVTNEEAGQTLMSRSNWRRSCYLPVRMMWCCAAAACEEDVCWSWTKHWSGFLTLMMMIMMMMMKRKIKTKTTRMASYPEE